MLVMTATIAQVGVTNAMGVSRNALAVEADVDGVAASVSLAAATAAAVAETANTTVTVDPPAGDVVAAVMGETIRALVSPVTRAPGVPSLRLQVVEAAHLRRVPSHWWLIARRAYVRHERIWPRRATTKHPAVCSTRPS